MKIFTQLPLITIFSIILYLLPVVSFTQYKWIKYSGNPDFMSLEDNIDNGRILYHKLTQNTSSISGNRGLLFDTTLFAFPSLTGSFAWSQVRVNVGKISFYPHIFTFDKKTSTLALAFMYNISRVSPTRGVRTRPSFSPTSLLQLEKEKMNFTKLKFVSDSFSTEIILEPKNQETELGLSDYDINYTYWIKSAPTQKETASLRTFFARPLTSFRLRAYSDKGYLDATFKGSKVKELGDVFVSTIDLYQTLLDPNYVNISNNKPAPVVTNTNVVTPPQPKPKAPPTKRRRKRRVKAPTPPKPTVVQKTNVRRTQRPKTTRVVKPK